MSDLPLHPALARGNVAVITGAAGGIGLAALGSLMGTPAFAANPGLGFPNFKPKAKRIIYLFQSGAPSQMDLFDPKPQLEAMRGKATIFIVTHRPSHLSLADQIIVLEKGAVRAAGPAAEIRAKLA